MFLLRCMENQLLQKESSEFNPPQREPSNSLDLIPVEYSVCGLLQEKMNKTLLIWTIRLKSHFR